MLFIGESQAWIQIANLVYKIMTIISIITALMNFEGTVVYGGILRGIIIAAYRGGITI